MVRAFTKLFAVALTSIVLTGASSAHAQQPAPPDPLPPPVEPVPTQPAPLPPAKDPLGDPPATSPANPPASPDPLPPYSPPPRYSGSAEPIPPPEEGPKPMSEGRAIVAAWNTGFQWSLAPGVVLPSGARTEVGFFLGLRLGYGFDTDSVIIVPGVRFAAYFTNPNAYLGMPVVKLVYPIDRFAPFVEGGAGVGYADALAPASGATGAALFGGGGFMIHFTARFALGAEANYQVITGTGFKGFGVGPIIAFAF